MNDFNRRVSYVGGLLEFEEKKRSRVRSESKSNRFRQINVKYHVEFEGRRRRICKTCFMKVFGENTRFLETVIQKKRSSDTGIVQPDCRGTHSKTPILEDVITNAREFHSKLPFYESHYSRRDCGKKFLSPHLTISALYEEYSKQHCKDN